jgi:hypothetical protein
LGPKAGPGGLEKSLLLPLRVEGGGDYYEDETTTILLLAVLSVHVPYG